MSPVDNIKYLQTIVVGTADAVIRGIPMSGVNYEIVVELLRKRYGQPEVIVN